MSGTTRLDRWFVVAFLLLGGLLLLVMAPLSPVGQPVPFRDQGVYLYAGQQLIHGARLYVDVWDHKAPVIHVINAVGQLLTPGSAWGVWLIQVAMLMSAIGLSLSLLRRNFGPYAAGVGVAFWLAGLSEVASGNMIQEYALLFQFATLYAFDRALATGHARRFGLMAGVAAALLFCSQPNLVAISGAVGLYLLVVALIGRSRLAAECLVWTIAGFLAVVLPVIGYFSVTGTFDAMWQAVIVYNALYGIATWQNRLASFEFGVGKLALTGAPVVVFGTWLASVAVLASRRVRLQVMRPLVVVALVALPVEVGLAILSGRNYQHYFVSWLPVFAVLLAMAVDFLLRGVEAEFGDRRRVVVWTLALVGGVLMLPALDWVDRVGAAGWTPATDRIMELTAYVRENTAPADSVLVWGAQPVYNWLAERRSPTRFAYQYPLYAEGYQSDALFNDVLSDLQREQPALILDTSGTDGSIPPIDNTRRAQWLERINAIRDTNPQYRLYRIPDAMEAIMLYIQRNYERIGTVAGVAVMRRR